MKLGFIGFGEAGYYLSADLRDVEGYVYDSAAFGEGARSDLVLGRVRERGYTLCENAAELTQHTEVIVTFTSQTAAPAVAESVAPHLREGTYYVDMNSTSPNTKIRIAECFRTSKGIFIEGAVMNSVPAKKSRVPISICGQDCKALAERLNGIGMNITALESRDIGTASAAKMLKSVMSKGLIALFTEVALTSERYGLTKSIFEGTEKTIQTMGGMLNFAQSVITQAAYHNPRLAAEMEEVIATLDEMGENAIMPRRQGTNSNGSPRKGFGSILRIDRLQSMRLSKQNMN